MRTESRRERRNSNCPSRPSGGARVQTTALQPELEQRRFTPAAVGPRVRPTWHKILGAPFVPLGVALIAINYAQDGNFGVRPGRHSSLDFLAGLVYAGSSLVVRGLRPCPDPATR